MQLILNPHFLGKNSPFGIPGAVLDLLEIPSILAPAYPLQPDSQCHHGYSVALRSCACMLRGNYILTLKH